MCRQLAYRPRQGVHFVLDKSAKRNLLNREVSVSGVNILDLLKGDGQLGFRMDKGIVLGTNDCAGSRGAQHLAGRGGRLPHGQPRLAGGQFSSHTGPRGRRSLGEQPAGICVIAGVTRVVWVPPYA